MAETSSLNCLSCRIPYQRLHALNAWTPINEKALLFTDFCFVASPSQNSVSKVLHVWRNAGKSNSSFLWWESCGGGEVVCTAAIMGATSKKRGFHGRWNLANSLASDYLLILGHDVIMKQQNEQALRRVGRGVYSVLRSGPQAPTTPRVFQHCVRISEMDDRGGNRRAEEISWHCQLSHISHWLVLFKAQLI